MTSRKKDALRSLQSATILSQLDASIQKARRSPNFFNIAPRILRVEGVHSDVVAWLLDPGGWHGLGDTVVRPLIQEILGHCGKQNGLPVTILGIEREYSTGNGPIDILIRARIGDGRFALGIENKIDASEGAEQLWRYGEGLKRRLPDHAVIVAFLAPTVLKPERLPSCEWASVEYRTFAALLQSALDQADEPSLQMAGPTIARHYLATLRAQIMSESNADIDAICQQLYADHKEAWHLIRTRLPTWRDEYHASIGEALCARLALEHGGLWGYTLRKRKYVCVFRPTWRRLGERTPDKIIGIPQAFSYEPRLHFRFVAGNPESDDRAGYEIKLKVTRGGNPELNAAVTRALEQSLRKQVNKNSSKTQFTIPLRSNTSLAVPAGESVVVPDTVLDWFARHVDSLIRGIDSAVGQKDSL